MRDVQILGPTPAERDLESAIEDALDARSVPYSPDAGVYVVDAETPAAIVRAMRELGWREPIAVVRTICGDLRDGDRCLLAPGHEGRHADFSAVWSNP